MNIQHLFEDLAKVVILQNDRIRNAADFSSKVDTFTKYGQILNYKVYCERTLSMIAYNMNPYQNQQLLHYFYHQKEECDKALQRLAQDALKDKLISKLAERRANNINWR